MNLNKRDSESSEMDSVWPVLLILLGAAVAVGLLILAAYFIWRCRTKSRSNSNNNNSKNNSSLAYRGISTGDSTQPYTLT